MERVLIIGALGQVGRELVEKLNDLLGVENVFPTDIRVEEVFPQKMHLIDVLNFEDTKAFVKTKNIDTIFNLAALLSATAEQKPLLAWNVNMNGLFNSLNLAKEGLVKKVFWPSSIAVFGPSTPKKNTAQNTITEPNTIYGISKLAGERFCEYYAQKHNLDVRSIRYPGLIGYKSLPGGGTTDYAVDIFHKAIKGERYECFLEENTALPMMFMEDAINATIQIMSAPKAQIKVRSSYNISGISFTPEELFFEIKKHLPNFEIFYKPDFRQAIANSWPHSIDDSYAKEHWGWQTQYDLQKMVSTMLNNLKK